MGPSAKRHFNGHSNCVSLARKWWPNNERWLGTIVIFQEIRIDIAKTPIFL